MSDDPTTPEPLDFTDLLPFDRDAADEGQLPAVLGAVPENQFLYIGKGLTADEFTAYVQTYDFGKVPPDFIVLHHSAVPSATYARYSQGDVWDAGEAGLSEAQIKQRRLNKVNSLKEYYRVQLGWDRGPHLFIDDRYIWLFTPMYDEGIHAMWGNRFHDSSGKYHYSIGIEVIGYYGQVHWPDPVARLVGHAVAVLKRKLGTFELRYLYPNGNPGRIVEGSSMRCAHPERLVGGGISSHRDYNKPECPGAAITESFYIKVLQDAWNRLNAQPSALTADSPILGAASGSKDHAIAYLQAHLPANSEYKNDVGVIMGYYWQYAPAVGVDPFLAAAQCAYETQGLTSSWAARPHRNPANMGVGQEGGLSFATWELAVQAHIGQLLAFALRDDEASDAQRQMIQKNPRLGQIASDARGSAKTLAGLNNRWTNDPDYASKIVAQAQAMS